MIEERIAVVGGGPAGCAAAQALHAAGHTVRLFEQAPEIGGRTWTLRDGPDCLDTGAGFITNFYPRVWALAKARGFTEKIQELHRVTGLHDGEALASLNVGSPISFIRFPLVSMGDKLRMAAWTAGLTVQRGRYDLALPKSMAPLDTRSIAELAEEDLSEALYHHLLRPGIEPFWYFACEDVSAALAEVLTAHAAGARFFYVAGGIDQICQSMLEGISVSTRAPVTALAVEGEEVRLSFEESGAAAEAVFDRVIIATTATVADRLTTGLPESVVSASQRQFLQSQAYAANIHIAFRMPRSPESNGLNSIFPCGPGPHPLAALSFHRAKEYGDPPDHELVSVYLSDVESRRVMDWSDEALVAHAWSLGRVVCDALPEAVPPVLHVHRRTEAIPVHAVGRYREAVAFQTSQSAAGRAVYFCGDYLATATIDGAIATGQAAAEALLSGGTEAG